MVVTRSGRDTSPQVSASPLIQSPPHDTTTSAHSQTAVEPAPQSMLASLVSRLRVTSPPPISASHAPRATSSPVFEHAQASMPQRDLMFREQHQGDQITFVTPMQWIPGFERDFLPTNEDHVLQMLALVASAQEVVRVIYYYSKSGGASQLKAYKQALKAAIQWCLQHQQLDEEANFQHLLHQVRQYEQGIAQQSSRAMCSQILSASLVESPPRQPNNLPSTTAFSFSATSVLPSQQMHRFTARANRVSPARSRGQGHFWQPQQQTSALPPLQQFGVSQPYTTPQASQNVWNIAGSNQGTWPIWQNNATAYNNTQYLPDPPMPYNPYVVPPPTAFPPSFPNQNLPPYYPPPPQQPALNTGVKIGQMTKFDGDQNLQGFIHQFKLWAKVKQLDEAATLVALYSCMDGEARDVLQNEDRVDTFDQAVAILTEHFEGQAEKYFYELQGLKRGSRSVAEYSAAFQKLRNKAKPLLNMVTEVQIYINGLEPPVLREKLKVNNPKTVKEAQQLAQKLEAEYQQHRGGISHLTQISQHNKGTGQHTGQQSNQRGLCNKCGKWHVLHEACRSSQAPREPALHKPANDNRQYKPQGWGQRHVNNAEYAITDDKASQPTMQNEIDTTSGPTPPIVDTAEIGPYDATHDLALGFQ